MHLENESVPPLYFLLATFLHCFATLPASRASDFVNFYEDAIFKHDKKLRHIININLMVPFDIVTFALLELRYWL
jgi:hypothetical protein